MTWTDPLALAIAAVLIVPAFAAPVPWAPPSQAAPAQVAPAHAGVQGAQGVSTGAVPASSNTVTKSAVRAKKAVRSRAARRARPGYGFLPGYEPPPPVDRYGNPVGPEAAYRNGWDGPRYWSRGRWYYGWGGPGFYRGRWNGGSFGPCYTTTPIGMMWTCGR